MQSTLYPYITNVCVKRNNLFEMGSWITFFSKDNFTEEGVVSGGAPDWRCVVEGVNFRGICKNRYCRAENEHVNIPRGLYDSTRGTCTFTHEITKLECSICKQKLDKKDVSGVGVYNARLQIKSKRRDGSEVVEDILARDKCLFTRGMERENLLDYEYIYLTVTRF